MPKPIVLHVHEHQVQAYIRPGGEVRDLLNDIARDGEYLAKGYILRGKYGGRNGNHVRSGRLLGGIGHMRAVDSGPLTAYSRMRSSAKHTRYFHNGTPGIIFGKGPYGYLLVPRRVGAPQRSPASKGAGSELFSAWNARGRKGVKGFFQKDSVSGQRSKPFLTDARTAAMIKNGVPPR